MATAVATDLPPPWRPPVVWPPVPPEMQRDRMVALNVCRQWVDGKGGCLGTCGLRHPRFQGRTDLFYKQVCHKYMRGEDVPPRGCHHGPDCRYMHFSKQSWAQDLTNIVGQQDAAWDWLQEGPVALAPEVAQDELTRLLRSSAVVHPETVIDGMRQLVHGDLALERYLLEVQHRVRR